MASRDDIVIAPRLVARDQGSRVRAHARESRRAEGAGRVKGRLRQRLMQAMRARRFARMSSKEARSVAKHRGIETRRAGEAGRAVTGFRRATRAAGPVGLAVAMVDMLVAGAGLGKQIEGKSARLVNAEQAHTIMGDLDEQATARAHTRELIESDPELLGIIGREGRINSQIRAIGAAIREQELARATGADLIDRHEEFDSPDSLLDHLIHIFKTKGVINTIDTAARVMRDAIGLGGK